MSHFIYQFRIGKMILLSLCLIFTFCSSGKITDSIEISIPGDIAKYRKVQNIIDVLADCSGLKNVQILTTDTGVKILGNLNEIKKIEKLLSKAYCAMLVKLLDPIHIEDLFNIILPPEENTSDDSLKELFAPSQEHRIKSSDVFLVDNEGELLLRTKYISTVDSLLHNPAIIMNLEKKQICDVRLYINEEFHFKNTKVVKCYFAKKSQALFDLIDSVSYDYRKMKTFVCTVPTFTALYPEYKGIALDTLYRYLSRLYGVQKVRSIFEDYQKRYENSSREIYAIRTTKFPVPVLHTKRLNYLERLEYRDNCIILDNDVVIVSAMYAYDEFYTYHEDTLPSLDFYKKRISEEMEKNWQDTIQHGGVYQYDSCIAFFCRAFEGNDLQIKKARNEMCEMTRKLCLGMLPMDMKIKYKKS